MDTFYFKPKATFPEAKEFYLRFNNDDILYFKEKEHNIFSALDIYKLLVKGKINNITIDSITFKVLDFINKYITYDKLIILDKDKLEYYNDSTFLYVDVNKHEVYINGNEVLVKYLSIDSDRHSDKEKLTLKLDRNNGIFVHNSKYLLFIHNSIFYKYQIKNV
jgi:hypothetical protein